MVAAIAKRSTGPKSESAVNIQNPLTQPYPLIGERRSGLNPDGAMTVIPSQQPEAGATSPGPAAAAAADAGGQMNGPRLGVTVAGFEA
jgi:hypothetical protein